MACPHESSVTEYRGTFESNAIFSPCSRYRYTITRRWGVGKSCVFICLNPSTATEFENDPTVTRCINFSKRWGYASFTMLNLFAYRATDPKEMKSFNHPVGKHNDKIIEHVAAEADLIVAAWGIHGKHRNRSHLVKQNLINCRLGVGCLGRTKDGSPKHPLYLSSSTQIEYYFGHRTDRLSRV